MTTSPSSISSSSDIPPALRRELLRLTGFGILVLLAMAAGFAATVGQSFALRWLATSLACWVLVGWQCRRALALNRSTENDPCLPTLGLANRISLLRGLLIAATAGFLATPEAGQRALLPYLPALLYTLAALGDALDGYLARRLQQATLLGGRLDTSLDALGLLVAPLLAVLGGRLHASYLLVSIAYYLFQWGIYWRRRHGRAVHPLPPSPLRRRLAGYQMALVATALWPPLPALLMQLLGVIFMMPLLVGFWRDWLHVSGRRGAPGSSHP